MLAFEYGAKIRIDKFINLFGGGASNVAINLSGLGFKTAALLEVGDDENGRAITKNLKKHRVATGLINVNKKADSGSSFILITENSERIIFTTRGVNDYLVLDEKRLKVVNKSDNVYIASLTGNWQQVLKQIFKTNHKKVFWNPGTNQYRAGLSKLAPFLKKTYCLMVNKDEALALVASDLSNVKKSHDFEDINNLLKIIKSYGPKIVVITNGHYGASFYDGVNFYHQKIIKEKKHIDTTGIGDVFNSTFAAGLIFYNGDIVKSAKLASKNAAHKIAYLGAQNGLLTKKELMK